MPTYEVLVPVRSYRYYTVEALDQEDALVKARTGGHDLEYSDDAIYCDTEELFEEVLYGSIKEVK